MYKSMLITVGLVTLFSLNALAQKPGKPVSQSKTSNSVRSISGFDLVDNSDLYNNKEVRVYVAYESSINYKKNLRYSQGESEGVFPPLKLRDLEEYIGSNDNYYSRKVTLMGAASKIILRIPISSQVPNIDNLGYVYVSGKWLSEHNTLLVNKIVR